MLCAWCQEPATAEGTIAPAIFGTANGHKVLKRRARTAPVCAVHEDFLKRERQRQDRERREAAAAKKRSR